ncbi:hypothetical protein P8452_16701 [Trifolium repens]|nr:hypothetical protein P8452_16697 [Trifolium repens]WJX27927.1 hypothetical protein P8452_16701 [Trifolium repens]
MCSQIEDQKLDWCNIFDLGIDLTMLGAQIFGKEASKTQMEVLSLCCNKLREAQWAFKCSCMSSTLVTK